MYQDDVRRVVLARYEEIAGDLELARKALRRARAETDELLRTVTHLEGLLAHAEEASAERATPASPPTTLHEAMVEVLKDCQGGMMRANDLAAEINRRRLYRMRDGRPVEAQQIHARVGNYPHLFEKEGTFIKRAG